MVIDRDKATEWAEGMIRDLQIATPTGEKPVGQLSGGNQQRVVLARWFLTGAKVLILNGPTVGVDIGAKRVIHEAIRKLSDEGHCIVLISSDLPELVGLSDRVMIMRQGRFTREMARAECTEESVLLAAYEGGN